MPAKLLDFLDQQQKWWQEQRHLKAKFMRTQFNLPTESDFRILRIVRRDPPEAGATTLYTHDLSSVGRQYTVKTKEPGNRLRTAKFLDPSLLPAGVLDSKSNYIVLDAETAEIVLVVWHDMLGEEAAQVLANVCEEAFALRQAGLRGKARAGTGLYVSAGYTVSYAKGMHCRISPLSNFKPHTDPDQRVEHETAVMEMASLLFATTSRMLSNNSLLQPLLDQFNAPYKEFTAGNSAMRLPGIDGGRMGRGQSRVRYQLGGFEFEQEVAKVSNVFFGRCASSPTHVDEDLTPVLLCVAKRQGKLTLDSGGLFYNLAYGVGVPLASNTMVIFHSNQPHGSTVLGDEEILHSLSMSVCHRTRAAVQRYNTFFGDFDGE